MEKRGKQDIAKQGVVWPELTWWIIGLGLLAIIAFSIFLLQRKGIDILAWIQNFLRFGR